MSSKWITVSHPEAVTFVASGYTRGNWTVYPDAPACYVVYSRGTLVYVGMAFNLRNRMSSHHSGGSSGWCNLPNLVVKYRPSRKYGDWAMVELRLIKRLRPPCNAQHCGTIKSAHRRRKRLAMA
jgi:predicted GIY-YIG superfamily endonuclease